MEGVKRWSVTYTKHVKQKRKVYQDGFLELRSSTHKIVLYNDCESVLDSRFVKKDEVIQSGEAIAFFDSYLVDIDHLEGDRKTIPNVNYEKTNKKADEKPATFSNRRRKGFSSPVVNKGEKQAPSGSLSPSQKVIREFKKKEIIRYMTSPSLPDTSKSTGDEWYVLYTTHVTQKSKKYHDGFLQLVPCGSQGRQIMLYDETRRLLTSRFLKKDEVIISGKSLSFDGYLVDIGECAVESKPLTERDSNIVGKTGMLQNQSQPLIQFIVEFDVMYTIQKTKKYHYGILRLAPSGSYRIKATLLSEEGNVLSNMFLKSSSHNVRTGTTLQLLSYFLEVGELRKGFKGEKQDSNSSVKIIDLDGECYYEASQRVYDSSVDKIVPTQTLVSAPVLVPTLASAPVLVPTQTLENAPVLVPKTQANAPVRAASDILNFIKRPVATAKDAAAESSSLKKNHVEGSHSVHSEDKILKEDLVQDLKCEPDAMHRPSLCNLEVDSLSTTPGRPHLESHAHIGGFSEDNNRSAAAVTSSPRSREKCLDSSNWRPASPIVEIPDITAPKEYSASKVSWKEKQARQLPAAAVCLESSIPSKDVKLENIECSDLKEIKARCGEASGVDLPAHISSSSQSAFIIRGVPSEQEMDFWKMDDAPSFDLGF